MVKWSGLAPLQSLNSYSAPQTPRGGVRVRLTQPSFERREGPNPNDRLLFKFGERDGLATTRPREEGSLVLPGEGPDQLTKVFLFLTRAPSLSVTSP